MLSGMLILAIVGLLAVFSVQNMTTVTVSLLQWRIETTLPVLIIIAVLLGVLVQQLVRQWSMRRNAKAAGS